ncbi:MAG: protein kinase domain-containing protein [Bacteroidales bacterium]
MDPDRWRQIERLYHDVLGREPNARESFLADACGGDAELRREVEALVAQEDDMRGFLERPVANAPVAAANHLATTSRETLTPGTKLGPYEITALIGAGGMGEVYKARDTRLGRSVAIKILPPAVAADPERRTRFQREARTIAALNHPHICALYDVGDHDASTGPGQAAMYLVMEHLDGETLAARLARGRLPLEQVLTLAIEIAEALAAAHRRGVVHRDLKPANVMLTKSGGGSTGSPQAKLLDFGLAKLRAASPAAAFTAATAATVDLVTEKGLVLGTVPYMAPEQVQGKDADARSDIFALGAVLYEMLTGNRAFPGESHASVMAAVLERDPPPASAIAPLTPPVLDRLVRQCLAKSPDDRPDTAHDIASELRRVRETSGAAPAAPQPRRRHRTLAAIVAAGGLALFAAGVGVMWLLRPAAPAMPVAWVSVDVRPADEVNAGGTIPSTPTPGGSRTALAWTPDGRAIVFVGRRGGAQQLYVRRLDAAEARPLQNTEGAQVPAVSYDGQWVAFWADGAIRKVPLSGGPAMERAPAGDSPPWGLAWGADGRIFFGRDDNRIWEIPAKGAPQAVTTPGDAELRHSLPSLLPGGRVLLYTVRKRAWSWGDEEVVAQKLDTGTRQVLLKDAADARYLPTGHLVFLRRGQLFAVPFDADGLRVLGSEVPVLDTVAQALTSTIGYNVTGAGQFAVAPVGTLAWLPGPVVPYPDTSLVTVDRGGRVSALPAVRAYARGVRLSPDGRRVAVAIQSITNRGLWLYDLSRDVVTPLAFGGEAYGPRWSPDRQHLVFSGLLNGRLAIMSQPADSVAPPRVLAAGRFYPSSFAPDGRQLAAVQAPAWNIVIVTPEGGQARVERLTQATHVESCPEFSPDGHWLAYASDDSGRREVYVQAYPSVGMREPVSVEGGDDLAWNANGRELFFLSGPRGADQRRMMAVEFEPGSPPRIGRPRALFEFDDRFLNFSGWPLRAYDVSPDGRQFYVTRTQAAAPAPQVTHINVIQNWFEELKAKVPVK